MQCRSVARGLPCGGTLMKDKKMPMPPKKGDKGMKMPKDCKGM